MWLVLVVWILQALVAPTHANGATVRDGARVGATNLVDLRLALKDLELSGSHLFAGQDQDGNYNCSGCAGCSNCVNCTNCGNCRNCQNCNNCSDCSECRECNGCGGCTNCRDTSNSGNCLGCDRCSGCSSCSNCSDCSNLSGCAGCHDQRRASQGIRDRLARLPTTLAGQSIGRLYGFISGRAKREAAPAGPRCSGSNQELHQLQ